MKGEGHSTRGPTDPDILARQIEGSNRIEGIEPSGEIREHLPSTLPKGPSKGHGGSPFDSLSTPQRPLKATA